jgi:hypothetical protein
VCTWTQHSKTASREHEVDSLQTDSLQTVNFSYSQFKSLFCVFVCWRLKRGKLICKLLAYDTEYRIRRITLILHENRNYNYNHFLALITSIRNSAQHAFWQPKHSMSKTALREYETFLATSFACNAKLYFLAEFTLMLWNAVYLRWREVDTRENCHCIDTVRRTRHIALTQ